MVALAELLIIALSNLDTAVPLALVLVTSVWGVVPAETDMAVLVFDHKLGPLVHVEFHEGLAVRQTVRSVPLSISSLRDMTFLLAEGTLAQLGPVVLDLLLLAGGNGVNVVPVTR